MPVYTAGQIRPEKSAPELPPRTRQYLATRVEVGTRDNELFAAACQFRDADFSQTEAEAQLIPCGVRDGFSEEYARRRIKSAYSRDARKPIETKNGGPRDYTTPGSGSPSSSSSSAKSASNQSGHTAWPPPEPLPNPITDGARLFIECCFTEQERVAIGQGYLDKDSELAINRGVTIRRKNLLDELATKTVAELYPTKNGIFIRVNPMQMKGATDKEVSAYRNMLVEFDLDKNGNRIPKEIQFSILVHSGFPTKAITDSGNKSLQAVLQVDAKDRAEFDERWKVIEAYFSQFDGFDPQNKNPSRYCRLPGVERNLYNGNHEIIGTGQQVLLALRIGPNCWAEWEKEHTETDYTDEELLELEKVQLARYRIKERPFPAEMREEAFYGIAGEIVEIITPLSEASREAILAQLLVGFGNLIGRSVCRKQAAVHHLNEFAVLVGPTARGRKGTAWRAVQGLFAQLDQTWLATRIRDGLQSGEAIIHAVRDEITGPVPMRKRKAGQAQTALMAVLDPGVDDKRMLLVEEEFGRLLVVAARSGNTLSSTLRKCWDGNQWLYVEGKISPEKATGAHISMIGHVTLVELLECLREVENRNGFSNRVLWVATKRVKKIALPGWINWRGHSDILKRLSEIMRTFQMPAERSLSWSPEGEQEWRKFYELIPETDAAGIVGPIIARSDAHVLRLSMLYAALDHSCLIKPEHLRAAIAFWEYCERSAQWAFAEKTGNSMADKIYWELQREPKGITRQQIREECFNDRCSKTSLDLAFTSLVDAGLAYMILERTKNAKKPTQRWFLKIETQV